VLGVATTGGRPPARRTLRDLRLGGDYEEVATPYEWKFTRDDLALLMKKLAEKDDYLLAA
jgi:hypothetical protein